MLALNLMQNMMMMMMMMMVMMTVMMTMMMMMMINQYNQRGSSDATKDQVFCTKEANEEGQLKNVTFLCLILTLLNN